MPEPFDVSKPVAAREVADAIHWSDATTALIIRRMAFEMDRLREQLAASEASRERLLGAATIGLAWMDHSLEFIRLGPSLREEVEKKHIQVLAAIAAEQAAKQS